MPGPELTFLQDGRQTADQVAGELATFLSAAQQSIDIAIYDLNLAGAAADAGVSLLLRERYRAAADHPVRVEFPEGEYLKGLLLERL